MKNLIEKIDSLYESFKVDANKNASGNKAAGVRARKTTLEIAKLCKEYRLKSVEIDRA
jgi:hypothetical protein